ncbi:phytanoyl-CoA dioxygenase family protein [Sorangium sp. So ce1036]|uniref:phytanoyl-CoA dioxygenase family protein n=1 Tax=Sorangium sp. So ce1036 TaxID=3133328 RepID=UPI003EFBE999
MKCTLTEQLSRNGYVDPVPVFDRAEADHYRRSFLDSLGESGGRPDPHTLSGYHLRHRWAYELATTPALLDCVEAVLGPDLVLWASHVWYKPPRSEDIVPWHCDAVYWPVLNRDINLTAWIALSPCHRGNGGLRVIPGSHRTMPHDSHIPDIDDSNVPIVELEMTPGQATFFSGYLYHGSERNGSSSPRIAYALRFTRPEVRFERAAVESSFGYLRTIVVRGVDRYHHNDFMKTPPPF